MEDVAMRQPVAQASGARGSAWADRELPVPKACGHTRYAKGCELCALAGIYQDHMGRADITSAERSAVIRLYLAGDKAGMFKLWKAWRQEGGASTPRRE
jgi:hypothetical protein